MTTLTTPPVQPLLERLFADARRSMTQFRETTESLRARGVDRGSPEHQEAARHAYFAVAPETGKLLYVLVRACRPRTVVEFGTSFGVSALHLAAALRDNGAGKLIATEVEPNKVAATRATLTEAGLADLVEIREGDAMKTLAIDLPRPIELLFLDGAKDLYLDVLSMLEPDLAPGALIVADNADSPGYRDYVRNQDRFVSTTIDTRVEVTLLAGSPG